MSALPEYHLMTRLERAFDHLVASNERLVNEYAGKACRAWSLVNPTPDADWLETALLDFWYVDGQDGRATRPYIGIVAADESLMQRVHEVNSAKTDFGDVITELKFSNPTLLPEIKHTLPTRHERLHAHLKGRGLARLNLKQTWRHIPFSDYKIERIRMAWYSSGRSIRRITVAQAEAMLMKLDIDAPHIQIQLRYLAGIPSGEALAKVQEQTPLMRANLFFEEPMPDGRTRRAMNVALPLFVPSRNGFLPDYNQPPPFPPAERVRAKRSDSKLMEEPFLPSLSVYRYNS